VRFLRSIIAFIAVPGVFVVGYAFIKNFLFFFISSCDKYIPFWAGVLSYIALQAILCRPIKIYIFGHEISHAIIGILSGAKIKKINVGKNSGSVVLTKNNILITLAPYFFPIYTFTVIIVYICLGWFMNIKQLYGYYLFLIGFSVSFHIALTIYTLFIEQLDLKVYGAFFSYVVILVANITILTLITVFIFEDAICVKNVFFQVYYNVINIYKFIYNGVKEIWPVFQKTK
jgi:hypothetical protein